MEETTKEHHGCLDSLIPQSRRPKTLRQMRTDSDIISFIRGIREKHPHIGKEKIKPLLDSYCMKIGIKPISVSTIGKVIKRYNLTFNPRLLSYHNPNSG